MKRRKEEEKEEVKERKLLCKQQEKGTKGRRITYQGEIHINKKDHRKQKDLKLLGIGRKGKCKISREKGRKRKEKRREGKKIARRNIMYKWKQEEKENTYTGGKKQNKKQKQNMTTV